MENIKLTKIRFKTITVPYVLKEKGTYPINNPINKFINFFTQRYVVPKFFVQTRV